ncbi:MAG TPA: DUF3696 domain-containing protein [Candidatus Kapabacteria bacterium]|nr:DUF3696 domain-containing protein [Candidatus Kapabacteria bacterium]
MRINKISIENFKCFKKVDLELGKLTLLTGANSSGKSSILYGILGPLQSGEFPLQFSPNGKYVNMGNFREMSNRHLKENIIKIGFNVDVDGNNGNNSIAITTWWSEDKVRKLPVLNNLKLDAQGWSLEVIKNEKYTLNYKLDLDRYSLKNFSWIEQENLDRFFSDLNTQLNLAKSINVTINDLYNPEEYKKKGPHTFLLSIIINAMKLLFNKLDSKINYISSFRLYPERTYYETTKTDLKVGKFGEDYVNQVILWETQNSKEYNVLIEIMKKLYLLEEIKSERLEGGRFELVVKVNKGGVSASLGDVGFGISQFLPIMVADLQLGEQSTLFVAQPEIHLHPSVQAEFGNYMVDQIKSAKKNYLIETHSEYLLNRVRLAIVKGEISKDDVKVYYFQNDGDDVHTHRLEFTTDGRILNAPKDFFRTYQMDVMDIAMSSEASGE